jgi:hypothetical protein
MLSQRSQYVSHREAEIDGHRPGIAVFMQVREGLEGLLEGDPCLAECGVVVGPGADLLAEGHGFIPHLTPQGVVGQTVHLIGQPVWGECFKNLDHAGVECPSP